VWDPLACLLLHTQAPHVARPRRSARSQPNGTALIMDPRLSMATLYLAHPPCGWLQQIESCHVVTIRTLLITR
jgi:hypothetical protein